MRRGGGSVLEVVGQRLVEDDIWYRLGLSGVEGRRLVEKDRGDDRWVCEKGEDPHRAATSQAEQREHLMDASEEHGPTNASLVCRRPDGLIPALGGRRRGVRDREGV